MIDFKSFITEAAQQGFVYEQNVAKALKKKGWVRPNYQPAGASSDRPDLDLFIKGKEYGCELKMGLASAGSLVLYFNGPGKGYSYGETEGSEEKIFLKSIGEGVDALNLIKKKWKTDPWIQSPRDEEWVKRAIKSKLNVEQRYNQDLETHPDIIVPVGSHLISEYYKHKGCDYLNVGTHGFYTFGSTDPAEFNNCNNPPVPNWDDSHVAQLRIRIQYKGGMSTALAREKTQGITAKGAQGYQITMELQFKTVTRSNYNLGLIRPSDPKIISITLPQICK